MKINKKKIIVGIVAVMSLIFSLLFVSCKKEEKKEQVKTITSLEKLVDTRLKDKKENIFKTLNGNDVKYNMNTRKIVALSGVGDLVAFGIRPLAAIADETIIKKYEDFFDGVKLLEDTMPFNEEEILNYAPELILVNQHMDEQNIKKLERIAPVIPLYRESFDFEERLGYIGRIFGLEKNANQLIQYAKDVKETALTKINSLGLEEKTATLFYYMDGISIPPTDYWYFNKILYDYLGLKRTAKVDEFLKNQKTPFDAISNESVKNYEGDVVIYVDLFGGGISDELANNPGWKSLKAVQNGNVGILNGMLFAEKDVLYLAEQYKEILNALQQAIKK